MEKLSQEVVLAAPRTELLQVAEVARVCGMSASSIWRLMRQGKFPQRQKIGRMARWKRCDLEVWLKDPQGWSPESKEDQE